MDPSNVVSVLQALLAHTIHSAASNGCERSINIGFEVAAERLVTFKDTMLRPVVRKRMFSFQALTWEGDFVRFRVGTQKWQQDLNFDDAARAGGLGEEKEALGNHWREWTESNKGGVSRSSTFRKQSQTTLTKSKDAR